MATLTEETVDAPMSEKTTQALLEMIGTMPGKAEIVDGRIIVMAPTGEEPGLVGGEIFASLRAYARRTGKGRAVPDNVGFRVDLPHRKFFSPDAAYIDRARSGSAGFIDGAPVFAVEVRSENDFGPRMEREIIQKRADYFAAGTLVVWDVNPFHSDVVTAYRASNPDHATVYRRGDIAEAEPAVPGWTLPVNEIFA